MAELLAAAGKIPQDRMLRISRVSALQGGAYLHWDKIRHLEPQDGLTHEQWWLGIKLARRQGRHELPFADELGHAFSFHSPDPLIRLLHRIDRRASTQLVEENALGRGAERNRYLISSLMDEAITSSQLEGASTTRVVAKELLRSGRTPKDASERMILCNYRAMQHVLEIRERHLTPKLIAEVHAILAPEHRLRTDEDKVAVVELRTQEVLFAPAPAATIPKSLEDLCAFANRNEEPNFLHPVLRAITVHFWLSYIHPYTDGNGRTARALFYWSMLHQGYHLAEFLVLSRGLRRAPVQYARAFLHAETDENDLTYFYLHQLEAIVAALDELFVHVRKKVAEQGQLRILLKKRQHEFNHRQLALLTNAVKDADAAYTIESHMNSHGTAYATARQDLLDLAKRRLLTKTKVKSAFVFHPAPDLEDRIARLGR